MRWSKMNSLVVKNYNVNGEEIDPKTIVIKIQAIYEIIKKYVK